MEGLIELDFILTKGVNGVKDKLLAYIVDRFLEEEGWLNNHSEVVYGLEGAFESGVTIGEAIGRADAFMELIVWGIKEGVWSLEDIPSVELREKVQQVLEELEGG